MKAAADYAAPAAPTGPQGLEDSTQTHDSEETAVPSSVERSQMREGHRAPPDGRRDDPQTDHAGREPDLHDDEAEEWPVLSAWQQVLLVLALTLAMMLNASPHPLSESSALPLSTDVPRPVFWLPTDYASASDPARSPDHRTRPRHPDDRPAVAHLVLLGRLRRAPPPLWQARRHCTYPVREYFASPC